VTEQPEIPEPRQLGQIVPFETGVRELFAAIDLLVDNDLVTPAITLMYATIDTMAWLALPDDKETVRKTDFIEWVQRHGLDEAVSPCTPEELYGARCGFVHSYSPESTLSRAGAVREIVYMIGYGRRRMLQDEIKARGKETEAVALHLADLREGLASAIEVFRSTIYSDDTLWRRVARRSSNFLHSKIPDEYIRHFEAVASWITPRTENSSPGDPAA